MGQCIMTRRKIKPTPNDTLPYQVTNLAAAYNRVDGSPEITVSWDNPTEYWEGTLIVKKVDGVPQGINDGEKIYDGTESSLVDTALEFNKTYYYRPFPYNSKKQYQTALRESSAFAKNQGIISYYGTIEPLSVWRYKSAGASIGDYALVAGGHLDGSSKNTTDVVDVYDKSLTKHASINLSYSAGSLGATTIGNYAVFAGGLTCANSEQTYSGVINAFDKSLTRTSPGTLSVNRSSLSVAKVNSHALFAGGLVNRVSGTTYQCSSVVDVLDSSLTRTTVANLSVARMYIASSAINDKAIFSGGSTYSYTSSNTTKETVYDTIDVYDSSLTKISSSNTLTYPISHHASTSVGNYALFCGGYNRSGSSLSYKDLSDAFDDSLTKTIAPALCEQKIDASANNLDGYALFVAGFNQTYSTNDGVDLRYLNTADAYDELLTKTALDNISSRRYGGPLVVIGDYALLAGGYTGKSDVDVYQSK